MTIVKTVNPKISSKTSDSGTSTTKPTHRRRPKEETENLILQEAERLLIERLESGSDDLNPLASLRITDVLASINAKLSDDQLPMTTGAAYQIWKSQLSFQDAILERIMNQVATPWEADLRSKLDDALSQELSLEEVIDSVFVFNESPNSTSDHELTLAIGLTAFVSPERIRRAEESANDQYVQVLGKILMDILNYSDRRLLPGLRIDDMVWAIEGFYAGLHLRARSHPELVDRKDANGRYLGPMVTNSIFLGLSESVSQRGKESR
jgi:hypothetical protein